MRRFAQLRANLPAPRPCPRPSRHYSTTDGHVEATTLEARNQTQRASSKTSELEFDDLFNFDGWWAGVDSKAKTVNTAVGQLPISPLMDQSWREVKRPIWKKKRQPPPDKSMGRFQRLIKQNPYAQMLAEPVRSCHVTRTRLPRPFLQSFGLVTHPETNGLWWMPASFEQQSEEATEPRPVEDEAQTVPESEASSSDESATGSGKEALESSRRLHAPAHALSRQDLLQEFHASKGHKFAGGHFRFGAAIPSMSAMGAQAIWRKDMHEVLREQMRRGIMDELIHAFAAQTPAEEGDARVNFVKLDKVEDSLKYQNRACFLILSGEHRPFDYLDVPGVPGSARAAHYLPELLGPEEMQRWKKAVPPALDGPLLLLKGKRNIQINKKLWSLQGFLADYESLRGTKSGDGAHKTHTITEADAPSEA